LREIVLDTETTGLDPKSGHRIIEIGCIELINHVPTDDTYWRYVNPERDVPDEAFAIHGLSGKFLSNKPVFSDIVDTFMDFIANDPLIIHNADFDLSFINFELVAVGRAELKRDRAVDTMIMAREKYPGSPASLDALCKRFDIDNSHRSFHGALKDARLLADVYLELIGGRQHGFDLEKISQSSPVPPITTREKPVQISRSRPLTRKEIINHKKFLKKISSPIWDS